jgi:hypothetical protein
LRIVIYATLSLRSKTQGGKKVSPPVKTWGDSYSSDIAESEYNNQIAPTPTNDMMKELN